MCSLNKSHAHIHYNIIPAECKLYFVHSAYFFCLERAGKREHDRGREDVSITVSSHDSGRAESLRDMFADGENGQAESRRGHRPPRVRTAPPAEESRASA